MIKVPGLMSRHLVKEVNLLEEIDFVTMLKMKVKKKNGVFSDQVQFEIIAESSVSDDTHEEVNVVFITTYCHQEAEVIQAKQVESQN